KEGEGRGGGAGRGRNPRLWSYTPLAAGAAHRAVAGTVAATPDRCTTSTPGGRTRKFPLIIRRRLVTLKRIRAAFCVWGVTRGCLLLLLTSRNGRSFPD